MGYQLNYRPEADIVELAVRGEMTPRDLRESTEEALGLVRRHACLAVLLDCRHMSTPPLPSQVQRLPEIYAARGADRRIRIALVVSGSESGRDVSTFYKMSARRFQYTVQLFDEKDEALDWLGETWT